MWLLARGMIALDCRAGTRPRVRYRTALEANAGEVHIWSGETRQIAHAAAVKTALHPGGNCASITPAAANPVTEPILADLKPDPS